MQNDKPIIISYPCNDMVHADFTQCLTMLVLKSSVVDKLWIGVSQTRGSIICASRNFMIRQAMQTDCSHVLCLDSDMTFPADALSRLLAHNVPIVGASYCMRREPRAMTHRDGNFASHLPYTDGIYPVLSLGMGCVLIQMAVFHKLRELDPVGPFFQVEYHGEEHHSGEDVHFFKQVNKAGIEVMCDVRLSREIRHIGTYAYGPDDVQKVYDGSEPRFDVQTMKLPGLGG